MPWICTSKLLCTKNFRLGFEVKRNCVSIGLGKCGILCIKPVIVTGAGVVCFPVIASSAYKSCIAHENFEVLLMT